MVYTVFISHSGEDMDVVYELARTLKLNGINSHVSEWYSQPGGSLPQKVAELLNASDCVLALLTMGGGRSRWVNQEIGYAKGIGKYIIPVVEEGVPVVGFLEGSEYIPFRRDDPSHAVTKAVEYLKNLAIKKEQEELVSAILGGLLVFFGLLALATAVSGKG